MTDQTSPGFADLALSAPVLKALQQIGYEQPSPIQAEAIPVLLAGHDLVGTAQTGTGKTAAFALPLLSHLDVSRIEPQVLVLTPTRELAIQVAEAFQKYAHEIKGFHVAPIYGGQPIVGQLRQLKRGVHVVVGTPGRIIDHLDRGSLRLDRTRAIVLDEADEMLRMGFIDDVTQILEHAPEERQIALFSATMPTPIRRIAEKYLREPVEIKIKAQTATVERIEQGYWMVSGMDKLDALTRMLEVEDFDGIIMFVRTKNQTEELAEKLEARGYAAAAINGDMNQPQRERTVSQLKEGKIDILVATDVAARGIDVSRISHVINYDIPYDTEAYIHRIGRTGRAGRSGKAILFVAPRERRMLRSIELATKQPIKPLDLPTREEVNRSRINQFKEAIGEVLENQDLSYFRNFVQQYLHDSEMEPEQLAAALAFMARKDKPLMMEPEATRKERPSQKKDAWEDRPKRQRTEEGRPSSRRFDEERPARKDFGAERPPRKRPDEDRPRAHKAEAGQAEFPRPKYRPMETEQDRPRSRRSDGDADMESFRIAVGHEHGVKPGNIVGAIANEAGLDSAFMGRIQIFDDHSIIDLPAGMPKDLFQHLKKVRVCNQPLNIERADQPYGKRVYRASGEDETGNSPKPRKIIRKKSN